MCPPPPHTHTQAACLCQADPLVHLPPQADPLVSAKLRSASGLALLHAKKFKLAARKFLEVNAELGSSYSHVLAPQVGGGGGGEGGSSCSHVLAPQVGGGEGGRGGGGGEGQQLRPPAAMPW